MIRYFILFFLISLTGFMQAQEYYIYVAAESEDEVSVVKFDGQETTVVKDITVGFKPPEIEGPHGITVSPDGKYWYLSLAHGSPYGKLLKYRTGTDELLGETELGIFPASMQISPVTGFVYVVNFNLHGKMEPSSVSVVDPETMTELTQITTGAMPHGSRLSADGMHQYSVAMMSDELFEISTLDLKVSRRLYLGHDHQEGNGSVSISVGSAPDNSHEQHGVVKPTWVIPHPFLNRAYVACNGSNELLEVDLKKWEVTHRLPTGKGPYNAEVSPDGTKVVVTYKSEGTTAVWDTRLRREVARIPNSRKVSHGIAISPDSRYAFISVEGIGAEPGSVDVIDLELLEKVGVAEVGKQAGGIAFWKMVD